MKTREFSNEFSSPDGIRTHDLFLEREAVEKSGLGAPPSTNSHRHQAKTRVR